MADMNIKCADERAEKSTHNGCIGKREHLAALTKAKDSAGATARHSPGRPADAVTKPLFIFYEISRRRIGKMPMTADGEGS